MRPGRELANWVGILWELTDRVWGRRELPDELPLVGLELGEPDRAVAVASRQRGLEKRTRLGLRLAAELVRVGRRRQATALLRQLEVWARWLDRMGSGWLLGEVWQALARADEPAWAERVWRSRAADTGDSFHCSCDVVDAWRRAGELDRAEALEAEGACSAWHHGQRRMWLLVARGRFDELETLFDGADPPRLLPDAVSALVEAGRYDTAERLVRRQQDPVYEAYGLARLAQDLLAAGQADRARGLVGLAVVLMDQLAGPVDAIGTTETHRAGGMTAVVRTLLDLGEPGRALVATALARSLVERADAMRRSQLLTELLLALGPDVDDLLHAEIATDAEAAAWGQVLPGEGDLPRRLDGLVDRLAAGGEAEPAYGLALIARRMALSTSGFHWESEELRRLIDALAAHGRRGAALGLARTLRHPRYQAEALVSLLPAFAAAGEHEAALALAADAQEAITLLREPDTIAAVTGRLALALLAAGEPVLARALALNAPVRRGWGREDATARSTTARTLLALGLPKESRAAAEQAWQLSPR